MLTLPNHRVYAKIFENNFTKAYRAYENEKNKSVIIKILSKEYPESIEVARFKNEYEILNHIRFKGAIKPIGLNQYKNSMMMILEDTPGETLSSFLINHTFTLKNKIKIALELVETIGNIHAENIIHLGLNPQTIIFDSNSYKLKILDFSSSIDKTLNSAHNITPEIIEENLPYISPEQTGKMEKEIDFPSDFYSLGVILFELLTHKLPFDSKDPLEIIHCHMAVEPLSACEHDTAIPKIVADIVSKLMMKEIDERYNTMWGLKKDLEKCLDQLDTFGKIRPFPLARFDIPNRYTTSKLLYGREKEINDLLKACRKTIKGNAEIALVTGYSGIGKTSLVKEVRKQIIKTKSPRPSIRFVSGKFEHFQQRKPYNAWIEAIRELIHHLLSEEEEQLVKWRQRLMHAFGPNGQIIIDMIPEVELIIGPQPGVPELNPVDSQNRFFLTFQNFIKVFCRPDHPLVIFLDDLHWVDSASPKLIEIIMEDTELRHFFLICAYRNNEIESESELTKTFDNLRAKDIPINQFMLSPLHLDQMEKLIADSLFSKKEDISELAKLVAVKSGGNPFFIDELLRSLYDEKLLQYNRNNNTWQFDFPQIEARGVMDNVADLLIKKIERLSANTQKTLQAASCIGIGFNIHTLASIFKESETDLQPHIQKAVREGLIVSSSQKETNIHDLSQNYSIHYRFSHDWIEQVLYSLIPDQEKKILHWKIGNWLLQNQAQEKLKEKIFDIVNQINMAIDIGFPIENGAELARLNLTAAEKAKASSAYDQALKYTKAGIQLLGKKGWKKHYHLTLSLYTEAAESACLSTQYSEMEYFTKIALQNTKTLLDKVKTFEITIQGLIAQNRRMESIEKGLHVLKLLGVKFPIRPNKFHLMIGFLQTKQILAGKKIEDIENLPLMSDPHILSVMRIISTTASSAYFVIPELMLLMVFKSIRILIKYGNTFESPFVFAAYGFVLCSIFDDIPKGYRFGNLSLSLLKKVNPMKERGRALIVVTTFITHWKKHLQETIKPCWDAHQFSLDSGDFEYAALSLFSMSCNLLYMGRELTSLARELTTNNEIIMRLKQESVVSLHKINQQVISNLIGENKTPHILNGKFLEKNRMFPFFLKTGDTNALFTTYFHEMILCYLFHYYHEAHNKALKAEKYIEGVIGAPEVPLFYFYDSLCCLRVLTEKVKNSRRKLLRRVKLNQKKLKKWALYAPMNYKHKFFLVEAERFRVLNNTKKTLKYFNLAVESAKENGFINEEALAGELAAEYFLKEGNRRISKAYIIDARYCYTRWGAYAKVKDLDKQYGDIILSEAPVMQQVELEGKDKKYHITDSLNQSFDLSSILKASQAIAEESNISRLLDKLMKIVIENAGARKGILVLEKTGKFIVEAMVFGDNIQYGSIDHFDISGASIDECKEIPITVINYVIRTGQNVVLNDATRDDIYSQDHYIRKNKTRSIFCIPIKYQGNLTGVLYLENNRIRFAFTPDRVEVLGTVADILASSWAKLQTEKELLHYQQKLRELSSELILTEERERRQIAVALHDRIGHTLVNAKMQLGFLEEKDPILSSEKMLQDIKKLIDQSIKDTHSLTFDISPPILYDLGLKPAISWLIDGFQNQHRLDIDFKCEEELKSVDDSFRILIFQSIRELLFNIVKHAMAKQVKVAINQNGENIAIHIIDDGIGFNLSETGQYNSERGGFGLFSIRERLSYMGGNMEIDSKPGKGTSITIVSPIKSKN